MKNSSIITENNDVKIWSESFGKKDNPAVLLIAGTGAQSNSWPDEFCINLATKGFFVIRYDSRDTGLSSTIDYQQNPYNLRDLVKDAISVLDGYHINKANIVGFSMGGQVAQIFAAYFSNYVNSITLIGTSISSETVFAAFEGKTIQSPLSAPKEEYVKWVTRKIDLSNQTLEQKVADFVMNWKILNGSKTPLDESLYTQIAYDNFSKAKTNPYINHRKAVKASFADHKNAPALINKPALIIHGDCDPIYGVDHPQALHLAIRNSKLEIIKDMGHCINTMFYEQVANLIKDICLKQVDNDIAR